MIEREQIEMDVVFVGAGPANLAALCTSRPRSGVTTN